MLRCTTSASVCSSSAESSEVMNFNNDVDDDDGDNNDGPFMDFVGERFYGTNKFSEIVPAAGSNGNLYLIPSWSDHVVSFNPTTKEWKKIGTKLGSDASKWWEAVYCHENKKIYCCPLKSNNVLIVDTQTDETELISLPVEMHDCETNKYGACWSDGHGSVLFFPNKASKILKMNIHTHAISTLEDFDLDVGNGFTNAIQASNGYVYVLSERNFVLKLNSTNYYYNAEIINLLPLDNYNDSTLAQHYNDFAEHKDGHIYAVPFNANRILRLHLQSSKVDVVGPHLGHDGFYSWSKTIIGKYDDCVYGIPLDASQVVRYDPKNDTVTRIGPVLKKEDKWWSVCLGNDGDLYCAPYCTDCILKVCVTRWHVFKDHVQLRLLLKTGRASPIGRQRLDDEEKEDNTIMEEDLDGNDSSVSCYRHFVQNFDDYLFRHVLEFL